MKNIILALLIIIPSVGFSAGAIQVTFTNQADFAAYNFINNQPYWVYLENDTTLPKADQINSLLPVSNVDTLLLDLEFTLISSLADLSKTHNLSLYLEGDKYFDTLFIPQNITVFSLTCRRTFLKHIYGGAKIKLIGGMTLYDNDRLKTVDLDLGEMDTHGVRGVELSVQQNDSLKTFYWNNPHRQLSAFSFFENRQLKHVHLETVKEKVSSISESQGGFVFNLELDSISGCMGLDSVHSLIIKQNYMLENACVFQRGVENYLVDFPQANFFIIQNNATGLKSLNDLLTADCSWLPNGVEELNYQDLTLYPNPAHTEVFVEIPIKLTRYQIYDMSGKIVQQGIVEAYGRIGLGTISGGMYVLLVGEKRSKLVIH